MIALANQTNAYTADGGSMTKTITIPAPTAGNTLIVQIGDLKSSTQIVSVSQGATPFTKSAFEYASTSFIETWTLPNCGSGTTISIVVSNTYAQVDVLVSEWSGMPSSLASDGSQGSTGAAATITTATITPTATGPVLVLAQAMAVSQNIKTPGNGFTEFADQSGTTNRCAFAYKILTAGTAVQCSWTKSEPYGTAAMLIAAFDGSGGGGTNPAIFLQDPELSSMQPMGM